MQESGVCAIVSDMETGIPKGPANERRDFIRIPFTTRAEVRAGGTTARATGEIDVSMSGIRINTADPVPATDTPCDVLIALESSTADAVEIAIKGTVVRSEPGSIAVHFNEIDLDSYWHLHQLILLNTGDPEKVEQEFIRHWGIHPSGR